MPLIPCKCTSCGAVLKVNSENDAAVCEYCKMPFIVENAVNNYNVDLKGNINVGEATINVTGANVDNLLLRAKDFESKKEYGQALKYYEQCLDADFSCEEAKIGKGRVNDIIDNYIFLEDEAFANFTSGRLVLKKDSLHYITKKNKKDEVYVLNEMSEILFKSKALSFNYNNNPKLIKLSNWKITDAWVTKIKQLKEGILEF